MATGIARRVVNVIHLGRMGFLGANDIQTRYARVHLEEIAGKAVQGTDMLLLVEHKPVYTIGFSARNNKYLDDAIILKHHGAEFYRTDRGGMITFHGPGQLVAYPVLNLTHFNKSMKWYISALENTLINTCQKFGIKAQTTKDTGVWIEDRKIGSIGVHRKRTVVTHGCSLNCNTDLKWYKHIVPCDLEGKEVTSLSKETNRDVTLNQTIRPFLTSFQEVFDCDLEFTFLEKHEREALTQPTPLISNLQPSQQPQYSSMRQISTLSGNCAD